MIITLHQAIKNVLLDWNRPLSAFAIAEQINTYKTYERADKFPLKSSQILSRVLKYPNLFIVTSGNVISLNIRLEDLIEELRLFVAKRPIQSGKTKTYQLILATLFVLRVKVNNDLYERVGITWEEVNETLSKNSKAEQLEIEDNINLLDKDYNEYKDIVNQYLRYFELIRHRKVGDVGEDYFAKFNKIPIVQFIKIMSKYQAQIESATEEEYLVFFRNVAIELDRINSVYMYSSPMVLTNLISNLVDIKPEDKVLDPFFGMGGLISEIAIKSKSAHYFGWEINNAVAFLGYLSLSLSGLKNSEINVCNSLEVDENGIINNAENKGKFDWIISVPPFGIRLNDGAGSFYDKEWGQVPSNFAPLILALTLLKENGRAILVLPSGVLQGHSKSSKSLQEKLVNQGLIEKIIELPHGVFAPHTNLRTTLVVLSKGGKKRDYVEIGSLATLGLNNELSIVQEEASEYGKDNHSQTLNFTVVPTKLITNNGYELSFNKYEAISLQNEYINSEYRKLKDILLENFRGKDVSKINQVVEGQFPYFQIKDISKNAGTILHINAGHDSYVTKDLYVADKLKLVTSGSILVSMIGSKFNSVLYKSDTPAVISKSLFAITCNSSIVLPEYMLSQFQEDYFKEQVYNITKGAAIPYRSNDDFLNLSIKLPSIEEQERSLDTFFPKKEILASRAISEEWNSAINSFAGIVKHNMMQPLGAIEHEMNALQFYLGEKIEKEEIINWDDNIIPSEILEQDSSYNNPNFFLKGVVERILKNTKIAIEHLSKAESFSKIQKKPEFENVKIKHFIENEVLIAWNGRGIEFKLIGSEYEVKADTYQLRTLFLNLIDNAMKHGYNSEDYSDKIRKIEFRLAKEVNSDGNYLNIVFQNNGRPFPESFSFDRYISKFATSDTNVGTGFGGFLINQIVLNHNGKFEQVKKTSLDEFQVSFKIQLPI
jgi:type I restriction enzyme M protein